MCVKDNGTDRWLYEFGKSGKERVVGLNPGESVTLSAPLTLSALGTHTLKLDSYTKTVMLPSARRPTPTATCVCSLAAAR